MINKLKEIHEHKIIEINNTHQTSLIVLQSQLELDYKNQLQAKNNEIIQQQNQLTRQNKQHELIAINHQTSINEYKNKYELLLKSYKKN